MAYKKNNFSIDVTAVFKYSCFALWYYGNEEMRKGFESSNNRSIYEKLKARKLKSANIYLRFFNIFSETELTAFSNKLTGKPTVDKTHCRPCEINEI